MSRNKSFDGRATFWATYSASKSKKYLLKNSTVPYIHYTLKLCVLKSQSQVHAFERKSGWPSMWSNLSSDPPSQSLLTSYVALALRRIIVDGHIRWWWWSHYHHHHHHHHHHHYYHLVVVVVSLIFIIFMITWRSSSLLSLLYCSYCFAASFIRIELFNFRTYHLIPFFI